MPGGFLRTEAGALAAAVSYLEATEEAVTLTPADAAAAQSAIATAEFADEFAADTEQRMTELVEAVPGGITLRLAPIEARSVADGDIEVVSRTLDDKRWIVVYIMDDGPVRYYKYNREQKRAEFLFTNRQNLEGLPLSKLHPVVIKARDGLNLVSYLTLPVWSDSNGDARPDSPLPMVLLVHGGPWARDDWSFDPYHQLLANRGYAALSVNFRGSTGFGKGFINASNKEWAGKMHDDLIDAVDWAVKEGIADPKRIAIMGWSYGGYATLVGLTFTSDIFACGVDIVGPSNLVRSEEHTSELQSH